MKRSDIAASSTPMTRSSIAPGTGSLTRSKPLPRTALLAASSLTRSATLQRSTGLKSRGPRMTPIRRAARGEDCDFILPGICNGNTETTVWCHSNNIVDGKGTGIKARDERGCIGCSACHAFYDGGWVRALGWTRELVEHYFEIAAAKSRLKLQQKGLIAA